MNRVSISSDIADYGGRLINRESDALYHTYMDDAKKPKGWLRTESFTKQGQLRKMTKMIALVSIPILILINIASYFTAYSIMVQLNDNSLHRIVHRSMEFANVIQSLQTERDMMVMYQCANYSQLQLIDSYMKTSESIEQLSSWPVNPSHDLGVQFSSKTAFEHHLIDHHKKINTLVIDCYEEIAFYSHSIGVMIGLLHDAIKASVLGDVWNMVVSYQKIVICTEDAATMRALGIVHFSQGNFNKTAAYDRFMEVAKSFKVNYAFALKYSAKVTALRKMMTHFAGYDVIKVIDHYAATIEERSLTFGPQEGTYWYGNMTLLFDALVHIQKNVGAEVLEQLNAPITRVTSGIVVSIVIIVSVIVVSLIVVIRVYGTLVIITKNIVLCVTITKSIGVAREHMQELLITRCTNYVAHLLIKGVAVPVRSVKQVSVVCFDVVDFHQISEELDIEDVTACLDELVAIFKRKCAETNGVFRARTFDQTLMAIFGVDGDVDHVVEATKLALAVLECTRGSHYCHLPHKKINARLSVHIGSCIIDVLDEWTPKVLLEGDDIIVAKNMLYLGTCNRIHVSKTVELNLRRENAANKFKLLRRNEFSLRGIPTYWLTDAINSLTQPY